MRVLLVGAEPGSRYVPILIMVLLALLGLLCFAGWIWIY